VNYLKVAEDILYAQDPVIMLDKLKLNTLRDEADNSSRQQSRLCTHINEDDNVHEMIIVHKKDMYVRPHKHINKMESLHIIEGEVDLVLFDENGVVKEVITLGDYRSGHTFYFRFNHAVFHTVIIKSDIAIFHEVTKGPFVRSENIYAQWAPLATNIESVLKFQLALNQQIDLSREKQ
jgi:cupin fold WbuC family metalloprotein